MKRAKPFVAVTANDVQTHTEYLLHVDEKKIWRVITTKATAITLQHNKMCTYSKKSLEGDDSTSSTHFDLEAKHNSEEENWKLSS